MKGKIKTIFQLILIIFLLFLFTAFVFYFANNYFSNSFDFLNELPLPARKNEITILAVGDIMLDRGVGYSISKNGSNDFNFPFQKISDCLKSGDIIFGNLESVISDKGYNVGSIYSFRANPKAIDGLTFAGFDIVSLANNHALDYAKPALEDSMSRLKSAGIEYVGAGKNENEAFSLKIIEKKGVKVGFLAYIAYGPEVWRAGKETAGVAWISEDDLEKIKKDIVNAKEKVDVLIVSTHSGDEYEKQPNNQQKKLYQAFIDAGADVVVGHHPHVVQPLVKYNNGWIAYSLGNFVFDQKFSEDTMEGGLLEIKINTQAHNKKIESVTPKTIKMNDFFQPELLSS